MASREYELNPVLHITTGAIGPAGKRVFYLQARGEAEVVTLIVEKAQVQSLAIGLEQYLQELQQRYPSLEEASPEFDESAMALEVPLDPAFRVGQFGLGYDEASDHLVLVARELQVEGADPEAASRGAVLVHAFTAAGNVPLGHRGRRSRPSDLRQLRRADGPGRALLPEAEWAQALTVSNKRLATS